MNISLNSPQGNYQKTGKRQNARISVCLLMANRAFILPVHTPQSYRAHLHATRALETITDPDRKAELEKALLSKEQQPTLARIKRYTDFNDLATQTG